MTGPRTPAEQIRLSAERIQAARKATADVSQEIADRRAAEAAKASQAVQDGAA